MTPPIQPQKPPLEARRLRRFRLRRRWTMAQAADWYGVSEAAWSRWEAGKRPVPRPLLRRIKEARR